MVSAAEGHAESRLCNSFQVVFIHNVCIELTRRIHRVAKETIGTTVEALASQSVYDLDRVIFDNSLTEGASELDVLTRMFLLCQRVAVDSELGPSVEYFDLLSKLRALRALAGPLTSTKHGNPVMLEQWRRDEVFDPGERVNTAHSPLACGDVFVRSGSPEVFGSAWAAVRYGGPSRWLSQHSRGDLRQGGEVEPRAGRTERVHWFGPSLLSATGLTRCRD